MDAIATTETPLNQEDIILYTLNDLPPTYQDFQTTIRTNLQPLNIDDFYTLLYSKETNLVMEAANEL